MISGHDCQRVYRPIQLGLGLNRSTKETRKREFLDEMDQVVRWSGWGKSSSRIVR